MIKVGILGCGRVVQNRYLDVFSREVTGMTVVAVSDRDIAKSQMVGKCLKAKVYASGIDMMSDPDVDLILVCSESGFHAKHSREALDFGKHVAVEKPPFMRPSEFGDLDRKARSKNLMLSPIFQNRFNPPMKALKEAVETGRFGKLISASIRLHWCRTQDYYDDGWHGTWRLDGGVLNQQAIHHVDALRWIVGEVKNVCGRGYRVLNRLEAEDTFQAVVEFESGAGGVIDVSTSLRPRDFEASISVFGEFGNAVIGGVALNQVIRWEFKRWLPGDSEAHARLSQDVPTGYGLSHGPFLREIAARIESGRTDAPVLLSDAKKTVDLVHALYASNEIGGWVSLADEKSSQRLGM